MKIDPNRKGRAAMLQNDKIGGLCVEAAKRGKSYAEGIAPVRTGTYRNSFVVEAADVDQKGETRSGARLKNTAPHAWAVEHGRGAHHVLSRTAAFIEAG